MKNKRKPPQLAELVKTHRPNPAWDKLESEAVEIEKSDKHKIYRNRDGSMTAVLGQVHAPSENELVLDEETKQYHSKNTAFLARFPKELGEMLFVLKRMVISLILCCWMLIKKMRTKLDFTSAAQTTSAVPLTCRKRIIASCVIIVLRRAVILNTLFKMTV